MRLGRNFHLTYCSNIHAAETWADVYRNLQRYLPEVRQKVGRRGSFGVGLRLSAEAASALADRKALEGFQTFLRENDFYLFTINGFPYGTFHGQRVKEDVYLPDWKDPLRLDYTNRLAELLAELMPPEIEGSVSTVPGAFQTNVRSAADVKCIASNMLRHVAFLREIKMRTGRVVTLAIEPEPCCYIETVDEAIRFFKDELLSGPSLRTYGLNESDVLAHAGLCFDACHMAVEFEDPGDALARIKNSGVRIFKVQISSALRLRGDEPAAAIALLQPFAESTYLHQVVQRDASGLHRYADLPDAFGAAASPQSSREWRVHFHVPIFLADRAEGLSTTQDYLVEVLRLLRDQPVCPYLEVETYTWDVLPDAYRGADISTAIARELAWVVQQLSDE